MSATLAQPKHLLFARIHDTRVHYGFHAAEESTAHTLTLVCIHGFGGNLSTWNDLLPQLTKKYNVLRLDLRGFGFSAKPNDWRYDATDQADLVAGLVRQLGLRNVVLIGHSYGSAVALHAYHRLANCTTVQPRGVVVIDGAAFPLRFPFQVAVYRFPTLQRIAAAITSPEWRVEFTLRRLYFTKSRIKPEIVHRYAYFLDLPGSQTAFARVARSIDSSDSRAITENLSNVTVPCLIIWGEEDTIIPISHAERFARALPNSTVAIIPECGHAPQEEQPQATIVALLTFLESLP
jgi:pimeloyl-ACP methyl ester carboxylesterase